MNFIQERNFHTLFAGGLVAASFKRDDSEPSYRTDAHTSDILNSFKSILNVKKSYSC
jgi:hypothetical protein